jgi:spore coat protein U-like protein
VTAAHRLAVLAVLGGFAMSSACRAACNVSATALPFGTYNPTSAGAKDATGTVTVTCTVLVALNLSWTVTMSKGLSPSYSPRQMSNGTGRLNYNIYTNAARTTVWGDGTASTNSISDSIILQIGTTVTNYTMYGRIPALQDVRAGPYSDSIVLTIDY